MADVPTEQTYLAQSSSPTAARIAIAYARSWNTLDAKPFLSTTTDATTYDSQMALDTLTGDEIRDYFEGKMETFREMGEESRVFAELGTRAGSPDPVVLIHHRQEGADRGLGERTATVLFKAAEDGSCESVNLVMMGRFSGAGIFPGLSSAVLENARQYEPAPIDLSGPLDFYVITMMANDQLGQALTEVVQTICADISNTRLHSIPGGHPQNHEFMREGSFTGYPALIVRAGSKIVFKHQGLIPSFVLEARLFHAIGEERMLPANPIAEPPNDGGGTHKD